ncbi:Late embryogenesis abundant protein, LEA-14 [Corchorus olitorius]|uniref:Late embryogenesis abundant protein, LEA-14 n=1 Tax=Corchorus olitorius TaxID=93759 RepID=A0A1R3KG99_9ROSI|nr:Late embryogenesis abundant protein, LEA-14 [Corchorus olitorius]
MGDREQVKPLAPAAFQSRSDDEEALSKQFKLKNKKYVIQCCGCVAALVLILAVVILVLFFTVFRIHDPKIRFNSATILQPPAFFPNGSLRTDVNVTLFADVSVKNPNAASFKFNNSTTLIYYGGKVVGEGVHLQGKAEARRTLRRNVTVNIIPEKVLEVPNAVADFASGALNISGYSRISGRVKILNIIKKNVVVKFNCSMTYRILTQDFVGEKCRPELEM